MTKTGMTDDSVVETTAKVIVSVMKRKFIKDPLTCGADTYLVELKTRGADRSVSLRDMRSAIESVTGCPAAWQRLKEGKFGFYIDRNDKRVNVTSCDVIVLEVDWTPAGASPEDVWRYENRVAVSQLTVQICPNIHNVSVPTVRTHMTLADVGAALQKQLDLTTSELTFLTRAAARAAVRVVVASDTPLLELRHGELLCDLTVEHFAVRRMQLFVKTTGATITLEISSHATIADLIDLVAAKASRPNYSFRLIFRSVQLEPDDGLLCTYGIVKESTLHLVGRLTGGMMHATSGRSDMSALGCS